ncbi:hypothetical protein K438DRAFT_2023439 [Mycena galopus ATCC 62051]|nr:hypothetical protein K438DRAFT_2023439 [Mycena galopus ATCC 62051]
MMQIFRNQHCFRSTDNEDQLLNIGAEGFEAYLKADDIPYKMDVEDLLGSRILPASPSLVFLNSACTFTLPYPFPLLVDALLTRYDNNRPDALRRYPPRPWTRLITADTAHLATPDTLPRRPPVGCVLPVLAFVSPLFSPLTFVRPLPSRPFLASLVSYQYCPHPRRFDPREHYTTAESIVCAYFGTVRVEGGLAKEEEALNDSGFATASGDEAGGWGRAEMRQRGAAPCRCRI